jgi:hypothetical protein
MKTREFFINFETGLNLFGGFCKSSKLFTEKEKKKKA